MLKSNPNVKAKTHSSRQSDGKNKSSLFLDPGILKEPGLKDLFACFKGVQIREYPARKIVFMPEDSLCEKLYILLQGRVDLYRLTASGKQLVTRRILPGSVFGVRAIIGRKMQKNIAEAVEDSTICIISHNQVMILLKRRPEMMLHILEAMCNRLILLEERLLDIMYSPVEVKLAHFLLANIDASESLTNTTHEEIGNSIGAARQTVTETLSHLRKQGILITEPRRIKVIDRYKLEEIARK
jgi:CRP/FNR family transcriptional regulator, cyclic AMP receptor protein